MVYIVIPAYIEISHAHSQVIWHVNVKSYASRRVSVSYPVNCLFEIVVLEIVFILPIFPIFILRKLMRYPYN